MTKNFKKIYILLILQYLNYRWIYSIFYGKNLLGYPLSVGPRASF